PPTAGGARAAGHAHAPAAQAMCMSARTLTMPAHLENGDLVVPPDSYFGMGDNRDLSLDSRYWGFIPRENVIGRPMFIYWSFETSEDQYQQREFGQRVAFLGKVII